MQIEEIILEKIRFGISHVMSGTLRDSLKLTTDWDIFSDDILRQLKGYLVGNKVNTEQYDDLVKIYPATMWEELKEDFAPKWFLRYFPVRFTKNIRHRTVNNYRVCPHLDIPSKKDLHIKWLVEDTNDKH